MTGECRKLYEDLFICTLHQILLGQLNQGDEIVETQQKLGKCGQNF
jgi:hypothetical protein